MIVTVTNQLSRAINADDQIVNNQTGGPADLTATGGNKTDPLPYPFTSVGELDANGGANDNAVRGMHVSDLRKQHLLWEALPPLDKWQQLVNAGTVTFSAASETGRTDVEEEEFGTI